MTNLPASFRSGVHPSTAGFWTFDAVEERLIEAWGFLRRMPDRGRASPFAADGPWGQIVRDRLVDWVDMDELADAAARDRSSLNSVEVDRMNEALEWVSTHVPPRNELRRIVAVVIGQLAIGGSQIDWAAVKERGRFRNSHDALRMSYARSIRRVAEQLNKGR